MMSFVAASSEFKYKDTVPDGKKSLLCEQQETSTSLEPVLADLYLSDARRKEGSNSNRLSKLVRGLRGPRHFRSDSGSSTASARPFLTEEERNMAQIWDQEGEAFDIYRAGSSSSQPSLPVDADTDRRREKKLDYSMRRSALLHKQQSLNFLQNFIDNIHKKCEKDDKERQIWQRAMRDSTMNTYGDDIDLERTMKEWLLRDNPFGTSDEEVNGLLSSSMKTKIVAAMVPYLEFEGGRPEAYAKYLQKYHGNLATAVALLSSNAALQSAATKHLMLLEERQEKSHLFLYHVKMHT